MKCQAENCNKKIKLRFAPLHECSCGKHFCNKHKPNHNCVVNHFNINKKCIQKNLVKAEYSKVIKI